MFLEEYFEYFCLSVLALGQFWAFTKDLNSLLSIISKSPSMSRKTLYDHDSTARLPHVVIILCVISNLILAKRETFCRWWSSFAAQVFFKDYTKKKVAHALFIMQLTINHQAMFFQLFSRNNFFFIFHFSCCFHCSRAREKSLFFSRQNNDSIIELHFFVPGAICGFAQALCYYCRRRTLFSVCAIYFFFLLFLCFLSLNAKKKGKVH